MAIAFSSSESLARFVEPRVRVAGDVVTSAALFMTLRRESWVRAVHSDKSIPTLSPIKPPKSVKEEQELKDQVVSVTLLKSNSGNDFNFKQFSNVLKILVTLEVFKAGMVVIVWHSQNI